MRTLRGILAFSLVLSLCVLQIPIYAGGRPLGVLTLAYSAHLNASEAFAGLSVFDGECVSTDEEGKLGVRIGGSVVTLAEQSSATLQRSGDGAHVDMVSGMVSLLSAETNPLELHVQEAILRAHTAQTTQAQVLIFAPKVLQVSTKQGSLDFIYNGEFRVLPEGQTYRIYLESDAEPQGPAGAGAGNTASKAGIPTPTKVAYFIVAGAGAGLAAWGIRDVIESGSHIESPAKP
jgi:hypothetical protein